MCECQCAGLQFKGNGDSFGDNGTALVAQLLKKTNENYQLRKKPFEFLSLKNNQLNGGHLKSLCNIWIECPFGLLCTFLYHRAMVIHLWGVK